MSDGVKDTSVIVFTFSKDQFEEEVNRVKEMVIQQLFLEKSIDNQTRFEWLTHKAYIIKRPNFFGQFWNSITKNENHYRYILVEQKNMALPEDGKDEKPNNLVLMKREEEKKE
jgi:hypothetical protein